jgi:hypothetical protein
MAIRGEADGRSRDGVESSCQNSPCRQVSSVGSAGPPIGLGAAGPLPKRRYHKPSLRLHRTLLVACKILLSVTLRSSATSC